MDRRPSRRHTLLGLPGRGAGDRSPSGSCRNEAAVTRHRTITCVSHTNKPGGGGLALRRYLEATELPVRLVTMEPGGVWEGLAREVIHARGVLGLRAALRAG